MRLTKEQFAKQVTFSVYAEVDDIPVKGNALASGDDAFDKACEANILKRLRHGEVWAWASIRVSGTWGDLEASDYLGACSYESEEDFKQPGGYYDDMKGNVVDELWEKAEASGHAGLGQAED